jgi:serine/threonine protein kinase/tetratricopeptide (TPR) repeat protein
VVGRSLAHYRITAAIGAGGMGQVYRATDSKLHRDVALKVLPDDMAAHPERLERFQREARAVAALNHPNIVTIYSVEDAEGTHFLTMELVEGEALGGLIPPGGMAIPRLLDIAGSLADALAAAHDKGIVHRDLKPANVMVTRNGRVKVLDFGLAKFSASDNRSSNDPTRLETSGGVVMGTMPYMSPEQLLGRPVDPRSDLFSMGVMLYEMASGERPFQGNTSAELATAILRDAPPPLVERRRDLPEALVPVIERCLAKSAGDRFSSARDVVSALSGVKTVSAAAPPGAPAAQVSIFADGPGTTKSIVVLPFANLSPDPDTEYFSDGLTDEIITDLSRVRALRVISRSSAMRLKGDARGIAAIGRDLACQYVLEGSVRRAANSLRITTRLVDAARDVPLWADKFSGTLDDVFDMQERVSRSIVDALEIRLTPQEAAQLAERPITDARAQDSYLRARSEIWSFLPGSLNRAIHHLEAALAIIGDNALVYQGLGEAYFQCVNIGAATGREEEFLQKAEWCANQIARLEPGSPREHLVRANVQLARGDLHGSGRSLRLVLKETPNDVVALQLYTHMLGWLVGKPEAAAPLAARLLQVDPLSAMSLLVNAMVPLFAGHFTEAVESARRMFELDPVTPVWRANYVMALVYAQRIDEAEKLTEGVAAQPDSDVGTWWMGLSRAAWRADRAEVLRLADGPYRRAAAWDAEIPWALASAHAAVGEMEEALLWLDRAIDQGMINYPFFSKHDRSLDGIRADARFGRAMERARREWERFEA